MFKDKKIKLIGLEIVVFGMMTIWNYITPLWADDIYAAHMGVMDIIGMAKYDYLNWNGRIIGQSIMRFLSSGNHMIVALCNALMFVFLIHLVSVLSLRKSEQLTSFRYVIVLLITIVFIPVFGQTVLWRSGSGNYLWTTVLNLFFIWIYVRSDFLNKDFSVKYKILLFIPFMLLALMAGWSNENTSGGTFLFLLIYTIFKLIKKSKISFMHYTGMVVFLGGFIMLLLSPGNKIRTVATLGKDYLKIPLRTRFMVGFTKVNSALMNQYILLLVLCVLLGVVAYNFWISDKEMFVALSWIFSGLAIIYVLSFSPIGQDGGRSFFGGIIFIIIGLISFIPNDFGLSGDKFLKSFYEFGTIVLIACSFLSLTNGMYDSYKASDAITQRNTFILSQKKRSTKIIQLDKLAYYPQTKYGVDFGLQDIAPDMNAFPNNGYKGYLGVKGVILK
jgi:hypothetical protein